MNQSKLAACFSSLRTIICIELLGLEKLSNAFGMMTLCMGIAALIGPPFAGKYYLNLWKF